MAAQQLSNNAFTPAQGSPNTAIPSVPTASPLPPGSQGQAPGQPPVLVPGPLRPSSIPEFNPTDSGVYLCGSIPFVPAQYTCFADNILCPVLNGNRLVPCGKSCYDPTIYGCGDGGLEQIHSGRLPNGSPATSTVPLGVSAWPTDSPTPTPEQSLHLTLSSSSTPSSTTPAFTPTPERSLRLTSSSSSTSSSTTPAFTPSTPIISTPPHHPTTSPHHSTTSSRSSTSSSTTPAFTPSTSIITPSPLLPTNSNPAATNGTVASAPADSSLSNHQIAAIAVSTCSVVLICAVIIFLLVRRHISKRRLRDQVYPEVAFLYDPPVPPHVGTGGMGSSAELSSTSRRSYMVSQGQRPRSQPPSSDSSLRGVGIEETGASVSAAQAVERLNNERRAMRRKKPKLLPDAQPLKFARGLAAGAADGFGLLSSSVRGPSATNLEAERSAGAPSRVPGPSMRSWDESDITAGEANLTRSRGIRTTRSEAHTSISPLLPPPDLSTPPQARHSPTAVERQAQEESEEEPFYRRLYQRLTPTRNPSSFSQPRPFPYQHGQRGSESYPTSPHSSVSASPPTRSPGATTDPAPISFPQSTAIPFSTMTAVSSFSPFAQQGGYPPDARSDFSTAGSPPGTVTRLGTASSQYSNPFPAYPYSRPGNYTFLQPELYNPPSPKVTPHVSTGSGETSGLSALDSRLESGDTWAGEVLGALGSSSIFDVYSGAASSDDFVAGEPPTSAQQRYGSQLQVPGAGHQPHDDDEGEMDVGPGFQFDDGDGDGAGVESSGLGKISEEMSGGSGSERLLGGGGGAGGQGSLDMGVDMGVGMGMGPGPTTTTTVEGNGGGGGGGRRWFRMRNDF